MTTQCTSTPESLTGVLLAGDAVLNLASAQLRTVSGTQYIIERDGQLEVSTDPGRVTWRPELAARLSAVVTAACTRVVLVSEPDQPDTADALASLQQRAIPHLHCVLAMECEADAFMDEADAEAVAERLRQLGYI